MSFYLQFDDCMTNSENHPKKAFEQRIKETRINM